MKLFGKKEAGEDMSDQQIDDIGGADGGFDEGPVAPTRKNAAATGGRKGALMILFLLVAGGLGGGYVFLNSMAGEEAPPVRAARIDTPGTQERQAGDAGPAAAISDPLALDMAPDAAADSALNIPAPPQPQPAGKTAQPAMAEADPAAQAGAAAPAAGEASGQLENTQPVDAQPVDALSADDPLGAPPADEALAIPLGGDSGSSDAAEAAVAETAEAPAASSGPVAASLPDAGTVQDVAAGDTQEAKTDSSAPAPDQAAPSEAERALVENAPVMQQEESAQPPTPEEAMEAISNVVEHDAIVRPVPKEYLVVHKDKNADDLDTRLTAARLALAQNRNQAALQFFNEMYQENPRDHRVQMGRAVALQKLGQMEEALTAYEEVLTDDPKNLEALTNMLGLIKAQDPALALEKLAELREAYPYNADISAQLGVAHAENGDFEAAIKYLNMADALKPGSAYVLYNRAVVYDRSGQTTAAADIYRQIVRMHAEGNLDVGVPVETIKKRLATIR